MESPAAAGVITKYHEHPLKYVNYKDKRSSAYSGGWICNECRVHIGSNQDNLYCGICNYDICGNCKQKEDSEKA